MLVRYDPFETLARWTDTVDRDLFRPWFNWSADEAMDLFRPGFGATDITETDEELTVSMDLPGLDRKDISVEAKDGMLTVRAERRDERKEEHKTYHRYERVYGKFVRSFTLPAEADLEKVEAKYKDGVLTIHIPKTEEAKGRKIKVQA